MTDPWLMAVGGGALGLIWWELRSMRDRMHRLEGAVVVWTQVLDRMDGIEKRRSGK